MDSPLLCNLLCPAPTHEVPTCRSMRCRLADAACSYSACAHLSAASSEHALQARSCVRAALTLLDGRPVRSLSAHARSRSTAGAGADTCTSVLTPPPLQPDGDSLAPQISPRVMRPALHDSPVLIGHAQAALTCVTFCLTIEAALFEPTEHDACMPAHMAARCRPAPHHHS